MQDKKTAQELQAHRQDSWMKIGFAFTLSQMAFNGSSDQSLAGAREFIRTFQNLWEPEMKPVQLPVKSLSQDEATRIADK